MQRSQKSIVCSGVSSLSSDPGYKLNKWSISFNAKKATMTSSFFTYLMKMMKGGGGTTNTCVKVVTQIEDKQVDGTRREEQLKTTTIT